MSRSGSATIRCEQFARLGDASYAIYIVHFFFVTAIGTLFQKSDVLRNAVGPYGYVAFSVAVGIGAGILAHIFIEKPLLRLVRSWLPDTRAHRLVPAASREQGSKSLRHVPQALLAASSPRR